MGPFSKIAKNENHYTLKYINKNTSLQFSLFTNIRNDKYDRGIPHTCWPMLC